MIGKHNMFWGSVSPLGGLVGIGLLIMASGRLAWAVSVSLALLFIYVFSVTAFVFLSSSMCEKFFPRRGRVHIFTCICYFFGSIYILISWLVSPLATMEVFFLILLVPLFCAGSGIFSRCLALGENFHTDLPDSLREASLTAAGEAAVLALLIILVSLIREPLAFYSLSLPGFSNGMVTIFSLNDGSVLPIRVFGGSAGALLLLGYLVCLYRYYKNKYYPGDM